MPQEVMYSDVKDLISEMDSRSPAILQTQFDLAMEKWKLPELVNWRAIDHNVSSYEYTPEQRDVTFADATPMTCESNPSYSMTADPTPVKGFCTKWEEGVKLCVMKCNDDNVQEMLEKQHYANSMAFGKLYYEQFFFGAPEVLGYYGLVNHPASMTAPIITGSAGTPMDLASLTANEILDMMIADAYGMENPKFILALDFSRKVFNRIEGVGRDAISFSKIVAEALGGMVDVNFDLNDINFTELLDGQGVVKASNIAHPLTSYNDANGDPVNIANDSLYICYDAAVVHLDASRPRYLGAVPTDNAKQAKGVDYVNSCGFIIEHNNSVIVRHGIAG